MTITVTTTIEKTVNHTDMRQLLSDVNAGLPYTACEVSCCYCCGCHSDKVTRDLVERSRETLTDLVHSRRLVVVTSHMTYVAKDINAVSLPVQCPPNWARVALGNDTLCGRPTP